MLTVEIPGHRRLALDHLALDLRHAGSACGALRHCSGQATVPDGEVLPGVAACTALRHAQDKQQW